MDFVSVILLATLLIAALIEIITKLLIRKKLRTIDGIGELPVIEKKDQYKSIINIHRKEE